MPNILLHQIRAKEWPFLVSNTLRLLAIASDGAALGKGSVVHRLRQAVVSVAADGERPGCRSRSWWILPGNTGSVPNFLIFRGVEPLTGTLAGTSVDGLFYFVKISLVTIYETMSIIYELHKSGGILNFNTISDTSSQLCGILYVNHIWRYEFYGICE